MMESYTKGSQEWSLRQLKVQKGEQKEYSLMRPCLSLLGDCVNHRFYEAVGTSQISDGFLPRFTVLETDRESFSVKANSNRKPFSWKLLDRIHALATQAMEWDVLDTFRIVPFAAGVQQEFEAFAENIREEMLKHRGDAENALRGKVAEKVIKMATLCAVCRNVDNPAISSEDLKWATLFVNVTDNRMMHTLTSGIYDPAPYRQRKVVQDKLDQALRITPHERRKQHRHFPSERLQNDINLVTYGWLRAKTDSLTCFKTDRKSAAVALNLVLRDLEQSGEIALVLGDKAREDYGCKSNVIINLRETSPASKLF